MVKRQRTPHFITGLGDGHLGREDGSQQQRAGLRHPGHSAAAADDIFQVTKHTRRVNNNNNNNRLRPVTNERLVRMVDEGSASRWDMLFHSSNSADGNTKDGSFANPIGTAEQWQMSAFALVGMIVFLSAIFLHLVSDSTSSTSESGGPAGSSHHKHKYPRRMVSSGTTEKKKFDAYSSDEDSEADPDGLSDEQASTSTPIGAPTTALANKPVHFHPYQPRHRKPSVNGYKETYAGASYSPSTIARSATNYHSHNYYLTPMDGPVMMPSYPTPSSSSLKVRLSSPRQPPNANSPQPRHPPPKPPPPPKNNSNALARSPAPAPPPLAADLDHEFVATGLESFQSDPPTSGGGPVPEETETQPQVSMETMEPIMDYDEESQAGQPLSDTGSMSSSNPPSSADDVFQQGTQTTSPHRPFAELNFEQQWMNDSTQHITNAHCDTNNLLHFHQQSSTSNTSSIGMASPRVNIDITDLETPRAGLTRRTVDVMMNNGSPHPQGRLFHNNPNMANGSPAVPGNDDGIHHPRNPNDPLFALRLPSTRTLGMNRSPIVHQEANTAASSHPKEGFLPNKPIILLPALDPTRAAAGPAASEHPIPISNSRLELKFEDGPPRWTLPNPMAGPGQVQAQPPNPMDEVDWFIGTGEGSGASSSNDQDPADENRKSIVHVRPKIDDPAYTDAATALQSAIQFQELKLLEVIGGGGFGQVWRAIWRGTPVAVKVLTGSVQAKHVSKAILEEFTAEINLLSGMRHPNICLFMGACIDPPNRAIITELAANGSLWDALRLPLHPPFYASDGVSRQTWPGHLYHPGKHGTPPTSSGIAMPPVPPIGTWPWVLVKHVACGAARGMAYLHSGVPPILHRDLKSANILVDESYTAKICDFGLSRLKAQERSMTGNCGTVQWMAPEVLANQRYNEKADVYSFGIIGIELLTRECPFEGMTPIQCALAVLNRDQRPEIPRFCPLPLKALIRACVKKNPDERPTFRQIIMALDAMP